MACCVVKVLTCAGASYDIFGHVGLHGENLELNNLDRGIGHPDAGRIAYRLPVLAFLAFWLLAAPPREGAPIELRWDAPTACPAEPELRAAIEALLGAPLSEPRPHRMTVIASVQAREPGWSLRIFTVTADGTRERALRRDRDCATLARAAAVLIAMAIDPEVLGRLDSESLALLEGPRPAPAPPEALPPANIAPAPVASTTREVASVPLSPPQPIRVPAPVVNAPPQPPVARPRPYGAVRLQGGLGWGDLPATGGGLGVASALVWPRVRMEALAHLWPVRRVRLGAAEAGGDFLLWTLGARVCPVFHPHPALEVPVCAGFEAGRVNVRGVELLNAAGVHSPWFGFVLAPALAYRPTRSLALWLSPELVVPVTRTTFSVVDVGPIHRAHPAIVRVVFGIELRFPRSRVMDRVRKGNTRRAAH